MPVWFPENQGKDHVTQQLQDANARLIAFAPELLAALQVAADWLARSARIDDREIADDCRAAIAKAIGGDK